MKPGKVVFQGKTSKGIFLSIRYPVKNDLNDLLKYINTLSKEKTFIRFQGEQLSLDKEKEYLDKILANIQKNQQVELIAYSGTKLIAKSGIELRDRVEKHVGDFGISVVREFRNQGVGKLLFKKVLEEAKSYLKDLKIITLSVFDTNSVAIDLYKKLGFKEYGRIPKGIYYRNKFIDHLYMYRTL